MARYLYSELASLMLAIQNCNKRGVIVIARKHSERIVELVREHMPSGSGFDAGTTFSFEASHANKLVFVTSYHHMNSDGFYDGWSEHFVVVTPSLWDGFDLRITGKNRGGIKDYIHDMFSTALKHDIDPVKGVPCFTCEGECKGH